MSGAGYDPRPSDLTGFPDSQNAVRDGTPSAENLFGRVIRCNSTWTATCSVSGSRCADLWNVAKRDLTHLQDAEDVGRRRRSTFDAIRATRRMLSGPPNGSGNLEPAAPSSPVHGASGYSALLRTRTATPSTPRTWGYPMSAPIRSASTTRPLSPVGLRPSGNTSAALRSIGGLSWAITASMFTSPRRMTRASPSCPAAVRS